MIKVKNGQDPYSVIGKYIRDHVSAIEDIIAVIEIDGKISNELFMVDMKEDGYFIWKSDWYEGEEEVVLIDFFPVSEAINSSAKPNVLDTNVGDMVSRPAAIDALDVLCQEHRYKIPGKWETYSQYNEAWQDALDRAEGAIGNLPSAQPRPMGRWNHGICSKCGGYAPFYPMASTYHESNFCPDCGADMRRVRWMN